MSPPVFDLLDQLLHAAAGARDGAGVPVSLCGEAAGRPIEAMALAGLGDDHPVDAGRRPSVGEGAAGGLDLAAFRAVLASIRRTAAGAASLREPIATWARERGLDV